MIEQKINKSDYTDSVGKVWDSIGENIRNGAKSGESLETTLDDLNEELKMKLPIIPIKGHWEYITDTIDESLKHVFSK